MGGIYTIYHNQNKGYIVNEEYVQMSQTLRAAMYIMERDFRLAGFDPTPRSVCGTGVETANADGFHFTICDDTDPDNPVAVDIVYYLKTVDGVTSLYRTVGQPRNSGESFEDYTDRVVAQTDIVARNVEALNFTYLRALPLPSGVSSRILNHGGSLGDIGEVTAFPDDIEAIHTVQISIVLRSNREIAEEENTEQFFNPDGNLIYASTGDGYKRKMMSKNIKCRNLAIEE
jgi:hypothetical protein